MNPRIEEKQSGIAIYWGTFDPVTIAHFEIIKSVLQSNFKKVIVAINDNPSTEKIYKSPGESRSDMLKIMALSLPRKDHERLEIAIQKNKEMEYTNIKKAYPDEKVTAIVGQDSFEKFGAHCKWCDAVQVVPRGEKYDALEQQIAHFGLKNTFILPMDKRFLTTSSTAVRTAVNTNNISVLSSSLHPKVVSYINKQGFFRGDFTSTDHQKLRVFKNWLQKRKWQKAHVSPKP